MNNSTELFEEAVCDYCHVDLSKAELPILLVSTLLFNFVALIVLFKIRKKSDEINHYLVSTIAINDFGCTVIYTVMWIGGWVQCGCMMSPVTCAIFGWLGTTAVVWSGWIVVVISVNRYLATVKPLYYRAHVTRSKVHIALCGTFVFTLLQLSFPFVGIAAPYAYYEDNFICAYDFSPGQFSESHRVVLGILSTEGLVASMATMYLNCSIVYEMRKKNAITHSDNHTQHSSTQETKNAFAKVTIVVSLVFCVCYVPFLVRLLYDVAITNIVSQDKFYHSMTMSLLFLAPLLNPVVYVICNKRYRSFVKKMFRRAFKKCQCQNKVHVNVIDFTQSTTNTRSHICTESTV